jgi:hypothetical protein
MTSLVQLQRDIADRLERRRRFREIAHLVAKCTKGTCCQCGDVCPIRAANKFEQFSDRLNSILRPRADAQVEEFILRRTTWCQPRGELNMVSPEALFKTLRRAFDSLRAPSLVAVGMVDAWWGAEQWNAGARVFVAAPPDVDLYRAFDQTKYIGGPLDVVVVPDLGRALKQLFSGGQQAKSPVWSDDDVPNPGLRGEYYAWLAGLTPGSRIFRYGCDRYFNRLKKTAIPIRNKVKKGHPPPFWLGPWQFGSHGMRCDCTRSRRSSS